jgi:Tfp pilus assembly protein PilX
VTQSTELQTRLDASNATLQQANTALAAAEAARREAEDLLEEERKRGRCTICLDAPAVVAIKPCLHVVACHSCLPNYKAVQRLKKCPICRALAVSAYQLHIP